jgi:Tfp pilus assembly protein PilO
MRIFILSVATAAVLGLGWAYGLSSIQQSIANAEAGSSVRLDQQEAMNIFGRAG